MRSALALGCVSLGLMLLASEGAAGKEAVCPPTPADYLGPFYEPDAPVRSSVGSGYVLEGTVRSSNGCSPIPGARIEFWLVGPNGRYDADHRATLLADKKGTYRFESNFPPPYSGRPSHIHLRISAEGFKTLATQHYPRLPETRVNLDLVITPAE